MRASARGFVQEVLVQELTYLPQEKFRGGALQGERQLCVGHSPAENLAARQRTVLHSFRLRGARNGEG